MDLLLYVLLLFSLSTAMVCLAYIGGWALMNRLRSRSLFD
jgi:phage shock protein PspC (stress-responsive transcriptional regulator)